MNIVIVPLYKKDLNTFEYISMQQCFKVFKDHTICAIKPNSLDLSTILKEFPFNKVISFDDSFFEDIHGYNRLMLSPTFYERFLNYRYMLIYQPDAFAFSDMLNSWANSGYDYIGAPWLRPLKNNATFNKWYNKLKSNLYIKFNVTQKGLPKSRQLYNRVGNGGFSLRNIKKFYDLTISEEKMVQHYIDLKNPAFNEDLFWSIEINRKQKKLNIPDFLTAVKFSIETHPKYAFELGGNTLPFGCHAWEKNLDFWAPIIKKEGYNIPPSIPLISIAICTYNGEIHLVEQLDSLVNQDYQNKEIIVVDDGSSDRTVSILEAYSKKFDFLKFYQNEKNLGYIKNFERALSLCKGDFIALSDQDDIWDLKKLSLMIKHFEEDKYSLVYHDSLLVDELGNSLNRKFTDRVGHIKKSHKYEVLLSNCIAGHAMLFKRDLIPFLIPIPKGVTHDHWIAYNALSIGKVKFIKDLLVNYRQHENTITYSEHLSEIKIASNDELKKIERRKLENDLRIQWLNTFKTSRLNTEKDIVFLDKLIGALSTRDNKYFSIDLFALLLFNRNKVYTLFNKPLLSKIMRLYKESIGNKLKMKRL